MSQGQCGRGALIAEQPLAVADHDGEQQEVSSSSRPWLSSQATRVALPPMLMFWPGCSLSRVIYCGTPCRIRVEFSQSAWSRVADTTTLGMAFIWAAIGSLVFPANEAAKVW